ncbi:hypothetical protein [Altererythrobacter sp. Root672]|uniref:hypothetical protein n=1 Tax=Altererythrobacter sp. Root672 TaxID=1736584 RepID=UPI0012E3A41B|nr:hypothetical protein [Altererythrobacter sp. Root672]
MPRFPSDDPEPRSDQGYTQIMKQNILATRERGLREIEDAEEQGDRDRARKARDRVREAQVKINLYGWDR